MSAIKPVYKKYPVRDPYLYFLIITNFIFLESTILLEIITLDQIPRRPTIRKMAVKCSQTWLEDKLSFAIKAVLDMRVQKIIHFETFKMDKTTLFSSCSPCSTRRWARACWRSWGWCWGGHRSPGECLNVKTRLLSHHHPTLASYPHTCPCLWGEAPAWSRADTIWMTPGCKSPRVYHKQPRSCGSTTLIK